MQWLCSSNKDRKCTRMIKSAIVSTSKNAKSFDVKQNAFLGADILLGRELIYQIVYNYNEVKATFETVQQFILRLFIVDKLFQHRI